MSNPPSTPAITIVVRFSTSHSDLILTVPHPRTTTCLSLKQLIRSHLTPPDSTRRLRLIHAGKVLADKAALLTSLNVTLPPSSTTTAGDGRDEYKSEKAKGKQAVRDNDLSTDEKPVAAAIPRVYVHCSLGDALTSTDLTTEAQEAKAADSALLSQTSTTVSQPTQKENATPSTTTTPQPRGFDRLLSAGFTPAEVAHLRTEFLAIQAHTHTPDTMPSGPTLLALEERWLDNTASPHTGANAPDDAGGFGGEDAGGLEDMLYGNLMGFFWPVGAMFWLMREEGVWSRRKQIAVLSGFLVNLCFGVLRVMN